MDSFELNKIIAAILMVALLVIRFRKICRRCLSCRINQKIQGYQVEVEVDNQLPSSISSKLKLKKVDIAAL